jgi:hypothetical protein
LHQSKPYDDLQKSLDEHLAKFKKILSQYSERHSFSSFIDIKQITNIIERAYRKIQKILTGSQSKYPNLLEQDYFREKLADLFDNKVGKPYSNEDLEKVYKKAEKRFKTDQPPGYMDARGNNKKEPPECFSDAVIWFQLIAQARELNMPLIFVTDDQKEDWWLKHQGRVLGPRPELIQEMLDEASVSFYLYTGERFLEQAENFLSLSSKPEIIEEARDVGLENEIFEDLDDFNRPLARESSYNFQKIARSIAEATAGDPTTYEAIQRFGHALISLDQRLSQGNAVLLAKLRELDAVAKQPSRELLESVQELKDTAPDQNSQVLESEN